MALGITWRKTPESRIGGTNNDLQMKNLKTINLLKYAGGGIFLLSMVLSCLWFNWKLAAVIFLAITGNNFERKANYMQDELFKKQQNL